MSQRAGVLAQPSGAAVAVGPEPSARVAGLSAVAFGGAEPEVRLQAARLRLSAASSAQEPRRSGDMGTSYRIGGRPQVFSASHTG